MTGWTLPVQMGVEVVTVAEPVSQTTRASLRKLDRVDPIEGKVEGAGPVFAFSHRTNASIVAVNELLAAGAKVSFAKSEPTIYAEGNAAAILRKAGVDATSQKEAANTWAVKKPRIALYEPWSGNIDEGWTRWLLEQFQFPFTRVHNSDVQGGHLRDRFDVDRVRRSKRPPDHGRHAGGHGARPIRRRHRRGRRAGAPRFRRQGRDASWRSAIRVSSRSSSSTCR